MDKKENKKITFGYIKKKHIIQTQMKNLQKCKKQNNNNNMKANLSNKNNEEKTEILRQL